MVTSNYLQLYTVKTPANAYVRKPEKAWRHQILYSIIYTYNQINRHLSNNMDIHKSVTHF